MSTRFFAVPLNVWLTREQAEAFTQTGPGNAANHPKLQAELAQLHLTPGAHLLWMFPRQTGKGGEVLAMALVTAVGNPITWRQTTVRFPLKMDGLEYKPRALRDDELPALMEQLGGVASLVVTAPAPGAQAPAASEMVSAAPASAAVPPASGPTAAALPVAPLPPLPRTAAGPSSPQNIILHGPPGTGKTYATTRRALELLRVEGVDRMDDAECAEHFRVFQKHGRLEFVTFHQSYGYEEFVEGIRPSLSNKDDVQYKVHRGVLVRTARAATRTFLSGTPSFESYWQSLLSRLSQSTEYINNASVYRFTRDNESIFYSTRSDSRPYRIDREILKKIWQGRAAFQPAPTVASILAATSSPPNPFTSAHAVLWMLSSNLAATPTDVPQYVLIIDEINRGNISKILGEMITLLEPDKRLGMPHELQLPLTYSPGTVFGLPPNLHILGTMNTADRSIALLDVALRRRFTFEAVMPKPEMIADLLAKAEVKDAGFRILVGDLLKAINARIRYLLDADHQLGHAYFLGVRSYTNLREVFVTRVIPLLREYFHGADDRVCMVLGCPYELGTEGNDPQPARKIAGKAYAVPMLKAIVLREKELLGFDHEDLEDRVEYVVNPDFEAGSTGAALIPFFVQVLGLSPDDNESRIQALQKSLTAAS